MHPTLVNETIFGETAIEDVADEFFFRADIIVSHAALKAFTAHVSRGLTGDSITHLKALNSFSQLGDHPGELVAHDNRGADGKLDVIVIDMDV
jgi:hypothetical protein